VIWRGSLATGLQLGLIGSAPASAKPEIETTMMADKPFKL
jgi:hypothetical protein